MKNSTYLYAVFLLWGALSLSSCDKILDVKPTDSIDAATSLVTEEAFKTATVGVYSYLRETSLYGRQLISYPELLANNAEHPGRSTNLLTLSNNARAVHMTPWQKAYEAISQINIIMDQFDNYHGSESAKNVLKGELLFLRSLYYHNLGKIYGYEPKKRHSTSSRNRGTVPLRLKAVYSYTQNENLARADYDDFYAHLYAELEEAYELLQEAPNTRGPFFATSTAAAALLSRVSLYNEDWENVIKWSTIALQGGVGKFSTKDSYVSDWRAASHPESIFEVEFKVDQNVGVNNAIRADFTNRVDTESDAPNGRGVAPVSDDLFAMFDDADVRKQLIWKGLGAASNDNQMTKFLSRGGTPNLDNVPVIRVSEMYLNRAEAYANLPGEETNALADLNRIRNRAGLPSAVGLSDDALLTEVFDQRRLELCFEGHIWFDYKRLGKDITKPNGTVLRFTDYRILSRIATRDVAAIPLLRQNYNY